MRNAAALLIALVLCGCAAPPPPLPPPPPPAEPFELTEALPPGEQIGEGFVAAGEPRLFHAAALAAERPATAEVFNPAGLVRGVAQTYARARDGARVTVEIYDMAKPIQAFGVLMNRRPEGAKPLEGVKYGWLSDATAEVAQSDFYVQVRADAAVGQGPILSSDLAREIAKRLPESAGEPVEARLKLLPPGPVKFSYRYHPRNALGYTMLVDTLEAGYASGGYRPTRALYMHANTPERAKAVLAKLRKTHRRTEGLETLGEGAFEAEGDFFGRIIFFRAGAFIGGMISVPKGEPGVSFAEQFRNILRDAYADSLTPDERKDFLRSERR